MRQIIALAAVILALIAAPAAAGQRLALVIGNGAYGSLGPLANPPSDARLMSRALEQTGFQVATLTDADAAAMKRGILDFGRRLRAAGGGAVGLFFFAGHGVQADGRNFLIPIGVDVRDAADLHVEAVDANWVLEQLESAGNSTNIVVLDACRNNPFQRSFRSAARGLARMDAPRGSFVAYATEPGGVAADGSGANSPYSAALARTLMTPGLPIEQVFKKVRVEVLARTGGAQTPWDSSSLTGDFYFLQGSGSAPAAPPSSGGEEALWARARASGDPTLLQTFLDIYPTSRHAGEARRMLDAGSGAVAALPSAEAPAPNGARGGRLRLRIGTDWSQVRRGCNPPGAPGEVALLDGAPPLEVRARGGDAIRNFRISARSEGGGLVVTVAPQIGLDDWDPVDIRLDPALPGRSTLSYTDVRIPNAPRCGRLNIDVTVLE